jgi:quercetin dioxygenase-like cupin family protein
MAHIVRPDEGTPIDPTLIHKVGRDDLPGGGIGIIEGTLAPGHLIPPHTHSDVDELTYVLEGEITAEIGGDVVLAPAGSYVLKPRGLTHAFWNSGTVTARVMEMHLPGGFERYYARMTAIFSDAAAADQDDRFARMLQVNEEFGVQHHPDLIAPLKQRHGLT